MSDTRGATRLGVGSALRAFQALDASSVTFSFHDGESFVRVVFRSGRPEVFGKGADVAAAAGDALWELGKLGTITVAHASRRALVRTDEGVVGRLVFVDKRLTMAKVLLGGTHHAIPVACLTLVEPEIPSAPTSPEVK